MLEIHSSWEALLTMWRRILFKACSGSWGSWGKSDELPRVMSPGSAATGSEDFKYEGDTQLPDTWRSCSSQISHLLDPFSIEGVQELVLN